MSSFRFDTRLVIAGASLVLAAGAIGAGCGGDDVDYSVEANFCQAIAAADCTDPVVRACYGADDNSVGADTQLCINVRSTPERCNPQSLTYHPAYAQPCVDAHTAVYQSTQLDPMLLQMMAQACNAVFNKGGGAGASCMLDTDCDVGSGNFCIIHQGKGICQVPNPVMPGDACADPAAQCPDGTSCDGGGHCVADPTTGQACGAGISCASMLRCDSTSMTCAPQLADSKACAADSDCLGGFCIGTSAGGQCSSTYVLALGSSTCTDFTK